MISVSRDGKQIGQYSVSEINKSLASGTLLETDWAWYDGAADWVRITEVEGVIIEAENPLNKQDGEALRESIRDFDAPMGMNEFNFKFYCKSVLAEKTTFGLSLKTWIIIGITFFIIINIVLLVEDGGKSSQGHIVKVNLLLLFTPTLLLVLHLWGKSVQARHQEKSEKEEEEYNAKVEKYNVAYYAYKTALDDLEREDNKENRIAALEKGRTVCAMYREFNEGESHITAVDEQSITNDINARTVN